MERHYYRQYAQLERQHWWFTIRARLLRQILTQHLPAGIPPRILNVGCATGGSTLWLQQLGPVDSLEYDEECCRFCAEEVGIEVIQGSVLELPYESNQYDVVCAFDVIEHVDDHALAVTQLQRVCKPGGLVLISVPALMSLWSR
ncbi:MAG TPA: class I SAM-dependent methyltransferase, partial [Phnomibacter sp.]|nr:class I SAM-dependent methyltransferase [Phnomibacter sp.]